LWASLSFANPPYDERDQTEHQRDERNVGPRRHRDRPAAAVLRALRGVEQAGATFAAGGAISQPCAAAQAAHHA